MSNARKRKVAAKKAEHHHWRDEVPLIEGRYMEPTDRVIARNERRARWDGWLTLPPLPPPKTK